MAQKFFSEWEDNKKWNVVVLIIAFVIGTALTGIFNNFQAEQGNAQVFITLVIVVGFLGIIDTMFDKMNYYRALGMGKKPLIAIASGIALGLFLRFFATFSIATPFATIISTDLILSFFYIVVAAVLIEELFFRGLLQPIIQGALQDYFKVETNVSGVIALLFQSSFFSWYHWRVLNGDPSLIMVTFVFAVVVTIGNYYFKSLGFGIGLHFVNNLFSWLSRVTML